METRDMLRMANQISDFFKSYSRDEAIAGIAEHINKFWEPRMRRMFFAHLDAREPGFDELVVAAAVTIKRPKAAA